MLAKPTHRRLNKQAEKIKYKSNSFSNTVSTKIKMSGF